MKAWSMETQGRRRTALLDGSRLIAESCSRAGADAYIGYPITPASLIYRYASQRFPTILPAPDEITALQWMAGLSAAGKLPVTATSFPGLALMVESINMATMMELPMLIVLVQRLGPSTGTATAGAQDDLRFLQGIISGGYPIPVFCIADIDDCWILPPVALQTAVDLRTPTVLLTSKEMVMTQRSFLCGPPHRGPPHCGPPHLNRLGEIEPVRRSFYEGDSPYRPYGTEGRAEAPPFLPIGDDHHQVRLTASTHDQDGLLQHSTEEALENTRRLPAKVKAGTPTLYHLEEAGDGCSPEALIVTYGITSGAAREAVRILKREGPCGPPHRGPPHCGPPHCGPPHTVSLLVARTLLPVPEAYYEIVDRYRRAGVPVVFAEENLQGQFVSMLFGQRRPEGVRLVGDIGHMIRPDDIVRELRR